jgi:hypothetical protein
MLASLSLLFPVVLQMVSRSFLLRKLNSLQDGLRQDRVRFISNRGRTSPEILHLPQLAPRADGVTGADSHSEGKILDVLACSEHTLLHLLEIVWLQPVGFMVGVLAASGLHVAGQRGEEDHGVVLVARKLVDQLTKHVELALSV